LYLFSYDIVIFCSLLLSLPNTAAPRAGDSLAQLHYVEREQLLWTFEDCPVLLCSWEP